MGVLIYVCGHEPTARGRMMDVAFMGPNSKVWFLCCGVSRQPPGDLPSRRRGKGSLGLCILLPGQRVTLPGLDVSCSKKHARSLQRGRFAAVPVHTLSTAPVSWPE